MPSGRISLVTFQTGCANNLVPAARELEKRGFVVKAFAAGASAEVFKTEGLAFEALPVSTDKSIAETILKQFRPDVLLTGSNAVNRFEFNFRLAARKLGIPIVTLIDYWNKYRERFYDAKEEAYSLPDAFLVCDQTARQGLIDAGYGHTEIAVTGSPYFERLFHESGMKNKACNRERKRICFISQPLSQLYGSEPSPTYLGFTEFDAFEQLRCFAEERPEVEIWVKPHPREDLDAWRRLGLDQKPNLTLMDGHYHSGDIILDSDVLAGIFSNMLIEAAVMGVPAISIQIGSNGRFNFFGTSAGIIPTAFEVKDLDLMLDRMLRGDSAAFLDVRYLYEGALERCVNFILGFHRTGKDWVANE